MQVKLRKNANAKAGEQRVFTGVDLQLFHDDGTPYPMDDVSHVELEFTPEDIVTAKVTLFVSELGMVGDAK